MARPTSRILIERARIVEGFKKNPYKNRGIYLGIVKDVDDPQKLGRVKVLIPQIHLDVTPEQNLPWADVVSFGGGTSDTGSYYQPYVGSRVIVQFIQGHPKYPVVTGQFRAIPELEQDITVAGEAVKSPAGNELPEGVEGANDTKIIFCKTWKGHTIIAEEANDSEYLRVIDRAGNIMEFACPMESAEDRRGVGNAIDGGAASPSEMTGDAYIAIKDISGQEIKMKIDATNPEVVITTNGNIKLTGEAANEKFAMAELLRIALQTVNIAVQGHCHQVYKEGMPTSLSRPSIPDIPASEAFDSDRIFGSSS